MCNKHILEKFLHLLKGKLNDDTLAKMRAERIIMHTANDIFVTLAYKVIYLFFRDFLRYFSSSSMVICCMHEA